MAEKVEVAIEVKGVWCFRVCLWLTKIYFLAIKLARLWLPKASRNAKKMLLFVDFVPTLRQVV